MRRQTAAETMYPASLPATNAHRAWNALLDSAGVSVSKLHTNQTLLEKKEIQVQNESFFLKEEKKWKCRERTGRSEEDW